MLLSQGGQCAVCGVTLTTGKGWGTQTHIDHDHVSGKIRGLLCARCNTSIGRLGDSVDGLMRAVEYLRG